MNADAGQWKCPQCGRRYSSPGECAIEHPPAVLVDVTASASASASQPPGGPPSPATGPSSAPGGPSGGWPE